MVSKTLVVVFFLAASVYGQLSEFSMMDNSFGSMVKRQNGYYPTTHTCGQGTTCEEACGAGQITCPSTSGLYCYDPAIGDTCCPDGTGNSCSVGYFCTSDSAGNTYCCANGMSLSDCGAAYSLTVALISETGTVVAPTSSGSQVASSSVAVFTSSSVIHVQPTTTPATSPKSASLKATASSGNVTVSTASTPAQVTTNAANANGFAGAAVALGFAGVIAAL